MVHVYYQCVKILLHVALESYMFAMVGQLHHSHLCTTVTLTSKYPSIGTSKPIL